MTLYEGQLKVGRINDKTQQGKVFSESTVRTQRGKDFREERS